MHVIVKIGEVRSDRASGRPRLCRRREQAPFTFDIPAATNYVQTYKYQSEKLFTRAKAPKKHEKRDKMLLTCQLVLVQNVACRVASAILRRADATDFLNVPRVPKIAL